MPEKIADSPEAFASVRTMPESAPENAGEATRGLVQGAEDAGVESPRPAVALYNDLLVEAIRFYFDTFEKSMRDNMGMTARALPATEDIMALYQRTYMDGLNYWQAYWQGVAGTLARRWS